MWLDVRNLNTKVTRATDVEVAWLRHYLAFDDATAYHRGRAGEKIHLFHLVEQTFPTGFLPLIQKAAKEAGVTIEVGDNREPVCNPKASKDSHLDWLREYQLDAVLAVVARKRGIVKAPTGAGKTEIATGLASMLGCHWLFLVHRGNLLEQAAERFEKRLNEKAGRIGDGQWDVQRFTVATFQTLYAALERERKRKKARVVRVERGDGMTHVTEAVWPTPAEDLLRATEGLIVDECHTLPAGSFYKVAMSCPAYYRVGLSGTPLARTDQRSILAVGALGPVIYAIRPDLLIREGVLSKPRIRLVRVQQEASWWTERDWQKVYRECVVESPLRNGTLADLAKRAAKPCLVFVKEIDHGKLLHRKLREVGLKAEFVWGSDTTKERQRAISRLVSGHTEVLISSVIFQEGVDIPQLRSVVVGSGGKSVIAALQRIGRGMRVIEGKTSFEVYDIRDEGNPWLEKHGRARIKAYVSEGHEVLDLQQMPLGFTLEG